MGREIIGWEQEMRSRVIYVTVFERSACWQAYIADFGLGMLLIFKNSLKGMSNTRCWKIIIH